MRMITLQVKLVGSIARHLPTGSKGGQARIEVAADSSVDDLIRHLSLPEDRRYLVSVNDEFIPKTQTATHTLTSDDRVMIMPPLKGG